MGLRKHINDLEFSKKINCGAIGKKFENCDYARSIEYTSKMIYGLLTDQEYNFFDKIIAMEGVLFFPIVSFTKYIGVKDTKWRDYYEYKKFSNNPELILNK